MKPLRDTEGGSPLLEKARGLVDAVEPLPENEARMHRVRRSLESPPKGVAVPGLGRVPALGLAAAVALFGASAFAAVRYVVTSEAAGVPAEAATPAAPPGPARGPKTDEPATLPDDETTTAQPTPDTAAADEPPTAAQPETTTTGDSPTTAESDDARGAIEPAPTIKPRTKPGKKKTRAPEPSAEPTEAAEADRETAPAPAGHDSALVHRAVQALRRDGDPALAARLLAEHARRYPKGPLAEEALSLRVEAAAALGDPAAAKLARQYLKRYPRGRYAGIARRALAEPAP